MYLTRDEIEGYAEIAVQADREYAQARERFQNALCGVPSGQYVKEVTTALDDMFKLHAVAFISRIKLADSGALGEAAIDRLDSMLEW